ncbi:MAG: hypothetical protein QNJ72_10390 [Pleurocapsa sp. MO_226.B13]|nr:hypothetical protein [Pleurocapsa sp. MO_226.B13]
MPKQQSKLGTMTEGEKNRVTTLATDHDFQPVATLTPVGIFLPQYNELYLFFVTSKVTADCLVDLRLDLVARG